MRYRVLGAVETVDANDQARPLGSTNQRTVLAVLLAARREMVSIDALVDAVWPDDAPPSAVAALRTYVSRLRGQIGPALVGRGGGYVLDVRPDDVDAERFEALVDAAAEADAATAADLLAEALALWVGPAFGDRADVEAIRPAAHRLDERRASAREAHAAALLRAGRAADAVAAGESLVTAEPLREGAWSVLIEALAASHRSAEALRAYRRAAAALADAGLEPSSRLRDAERVALDGAPADQPVPARREPASTPRRFVPRVVPSSFVGRDDDVRLVGELLEHTRLVTLTGPGGVGKTRLALEVARRAGARNELGACVVELAMVGDPGAVPDIVVAALGLSADGRPAVDVLPRVGDLDVLIVLDNAEHVVEAAAAVTERILSGGMRVRILATSRERLAVDGEHVWTVAPLSTGTTDAPAVELFRERAAAVGSSPDDPAVVRIVRRLDGLPLAIEMAASQLDTTTADELAAVLDDRLDDLRSHRRRGPARHRSLADVLTWSEARLDEHGARTLAELSVFAGPVAAIDLNGVLGGPSDAEVVRELAVRSLVIVDREHPPTRFRLLQTIRSFARQRLNEAHRTEEMARRHAEWFVDVAESCDAQLRTVGEADADERLESTFAELRAANAWAAVHDLDLAAALSAHLHLYAQTRFVDEPLIWAEQLLGELAADHPHRPVLLASAATRALRRGDTDEARRLASSALDLAGDAPAALPALDALIDAGLFDGNLTESLTAARTMVEVAHRHDDLHYLALGHCGTMLSVTYGGSVDSNAETQLNEIETLPLPPTGRGWISYARGEAAQRRDGRRAFDHFADALAASRDVNNRYLEGAAIGSACSLRARTGDPNEALDTFADAVRHWIRLANTSGQLTTLRNLAMVFERIDAPEAATHLLGTVDRGGVPTYGEEARGLASTRAWAERRLGQKRYAELASAGAARDVTDAAHLALEAIDTLTQTKR